MNFVASDSDDSCMDYKLHKDYEIIIFLLLSQTWYSGERAKFGWPSSIIFEPTSIDCKPNECL
jgi:hypothetical protein